MEKLRKGPHDEEMKKVVRNLTQSDLNSIIHHLNRAEAFRHVLYIAADSESLDDLGGEETSILLDDMWTELDETRKIIQGDAKVRRLFDIWQERNKAPQSQEVRT